MRTVKTVLHTMAKAKGDAILDHLTRINDPSNSELVPYLRKLLSSGVGGKENQATHNQDDPSNMNIKNGNKTNAPGEILSQKARFTKSDHEALAEIFKKIGQKEQTKMTWHRNLLRRTTAKKRRFTVQLILKGASIKNIT